MNVLHHSQHGGRNCCHFIPDVLFQVHRCPWFLFVDLAFEIFSEEKVLRLGTLIPKNIEVPTKYPLSQDRIAVFVLFFHSKSPMLYRPALLGNWNALSIARRALKDKFPTPTVLLTTVLQNRQVFLPDPVYFLTCLIYLKMSTYTDNYKWQSHTSLKHNEILWLDAGCQVALEDTCQVALEDTCEKKTRRAWAIIQEKCIGSWEEDRPCRYTISWWCTNKYWSLFGPTSCMCGGARNRAKLI
jgi:hypothetical protein